MILMKMGMNMIIGLVRHFKVDLSHSRLMTSGDFEQWAMDYDAAGVIENEVIMRDIRWDRCYSSDLPRAITTAKAIYSGEIITTPLLREVPMSPVFNTSFKLPYGFWGVLARFAWLLSHKSQIERRHETRKRIEEFLNMINLEDSSNILVVCHGFLMYYFQKFLKRRGFKGKTIRRVKNGTLYVFEKKG